MQYATSESLLIPMNNFETPDENGMTPDINFWWSEYCNWLCRNANSKPVPIDQWYKPFGAL